MGAPKNDDGQGLSVQTLLIASLSSLAAAIFIHEFWQAGAILGAAVTPIIVAVVSEALRKPAQVISRRTAVNPPPVVAAGREEDAFGIWRDQRPRRRLHVKLAVATGLVAFGIAAFFLTGAELVLGGASDSDRFRVLPGKQQQRESRDRDRDAPARTQTQEEDAPAPAPDEEEEQQETVTVTAPPGTAPQTTPEEAPPETVPTPDPGATAPTP